MTNAKNVDDIQWQEVAHGDKFHHRRKRLSFETRARELGCSLYEVDPGKRSFPYHYHCANEEAIYVLAGRGTLRLPEAQLPLAPGDFVSLPAGPDHAHQVINTGGEVLRYLCFSTMREPEITVYPDSQKVGLFGGEAPGGNAEERYLNAFLRSAPKLQYFDGED